MQTKVANLIKKMITMKTEPEDKQNPVKTLITSTTSEAADNESGVMVEDTPIPKIAEPKFKVISIDKTEAPSGMSGDNWYRYVIGQGASKIEGLTMGDMKNVTEHAEAIAFDLNGRSKGGNAAHKSGKSKATPPNIPAPEVKS